MHIDLRRSGVQIYFFVLLAIIIQTLNRVYHLIELLWMNLAIIFLTLD